MSNAPTNVRFLGAKRTWRGIVVMSANDPKQTYRSASGAKPVYCDPGCVCWIGLPSTAMVCVLFELLDVVLSERRPINIPSTIALSIYSGAGSGQ
jgi:hypothetical protein